ncbi:hypothetical protein M9Y10_029520 [Tritrichomonas musculus]|uniref:Small GTP-binding protein n=1 Tax=Tritrichomonas musculus TaxID=1915356 RepID=A0ABR2KQP2_9EUKA
MEESEVKVVLLGQSAVGKTCIVNHLLTGKFDDSVSPTLGASYASKTLDINNQKVSLQIWDTAGQERFRVLAPMYYRGAQAAILVYSIIDDASFQEVDYWASSLKENAGSGVELFLVGNKCDLESERVIKEDQGKDKAESIGAQFFETSALTGASISDLFTTLAKKCIENNPSTESGTSGKENANTVDVTKKSSRKSGKGCC